MKQPMSNQIVNNQANFNDNKPESIQSSQEVEDNEHKLFHQQTVAHSTPSTSWVRFDDSENSDAGHPLQKLSSPQQQSTQLRVDSGVDSTGENNLAAEKFATIELSSSITINEPSSSKFCSENEQKVNNMSVSSLKSASTISNIGSTPASDNVTDTALANIISNANSQNFVNGDILVSLLPLNDGCDWITPAKFKPHLVPEELMAQQLTLTVEDYVSTMSMLLNDYRFNFYIIFYKRILALWISMGILVLLSILFSGWKGITLFTAGMLWLIINALGIFVAIFLKQKLYRMLEQCIAQVNSVFSKHNIFLGVDDRGRYSCHKVNLVFVYFDPKYCIKFLQDLLANSEQQIITQRLNNNQMENPAVITLSNTLQSIDTSDIIITGSVGPKNISQKEKYAEKLLLRYSQRWIRENNRERLELASIPVITNATTETTAQSTSQPQSANQNGTATTVVMMNNQQPHPNTSNSSAESASNRIATTKSMPAIAVRHCRTSRCLCQFIEEHVKYKPLTNTCGLVELFAS